MIGEAVLAYVSDQMFAVDLREAAAKTEIALSFASSSGDFYEHLDQVHPVLAILDLTAVGADLDRMVKACKAIGCKVIAFGPHAQEDLLNKAKAAGCDEVYTNSAFKQRPDEVLKEWFALHARE